MGVTHLDAVRGIPPAGDVYAFDGCEFEISRWDQPLLRPFRAERAMGIVSQGVASPA